MCEYTTPGQKNRYSREIHEVDLQFDHVILCGIFFIISPPKDLEIFQVLNLKEKKSNKDSREERT